MRSLHSSSDLACAGEEELHSSKLMIANTTGAAKVLRLARRASRIVLLLAPDYLSSTAYKQLSRTEVTEEYSVRH